MVKEKMVGYKMAKKFSIAITRYAFLIGF